MKLLVIKYVAFTKISEVLNNAKAKAIIQNDLDCLVSWITSNKMLF